MTKQLRQAAMAAVAVMTFAACGQGGGDPAATTGTVHLTITGRQAMTGVTRVAISVAPAGTSADLTLDQATGAFSGTLALPVGAQVITARAYAGATLVAEGSASVTVSGGQTLSVTIAVLDVTGPEPTPDHSPVLTALSASVATLDVGQTLTLSAAATDVDADPITFSWSASPAGCATFSPASSVSSGAASTTATAALSGACALSVQASAKGLSDSLSTSVEILLPVVIGGLYVPQPTIASVEFLSPAIATVLRSDADATVRHAWAAGTPVSVRVSWDDAPWLDRSAASLADSCGGAVTSTATTASSETFSWTPTGGAVCTLTASVVRQGLTDSFPVAVIVGPPSSCVWTQQSAYDLTAMPAGGTLDGSSGQGFQAAYGRTAFFVPFDWGQLFVPAGLTGEAAFAVEFDLYVPEAQTWDRAATINLFADPVPARFETTHGILVRFVAGPGQVYCTEHAQYDPTVPSWGWDFRQGQTTTTVCGAVMPSGVPIAPFVNAWHRARIEGVRGSTCHIRVLLDGAQVDAFDAACDATGGMIAVGAWYGNFNAENVAISNLTISSGSSSACVP